MSEGHTVWRCSLSRNTLSLCLGALLVGCAPQVDTQAESLAFAAQWFKQATAGAQDENLCHGLGLLKNPQFSCAEMLGYAARVDLAERSVSHFKPHDCFQTVCGTFFEAGFSGHDLAGNEVEETIVLKQDEGQYRVYWYRSNLMFADPSNSAPQEEQKAPEQVAYDALTALFPTLYEYPPCYSVRPSSSNLAGALFAREAADVAQIKQWANACPETFCFALVGQKIAPLCPKET